MFDSKDALETALLEVSPETFVSQYIFEALPRVFDGNLIRWIEWKDHLAAGLEVDAAEMVVTGSSTIGYSLNPSKRFKPFHEHSDIDVAVVSGHYFEVAWRWLRKRRPRELSLSYRQRQALDEHRTKYVYWGTIATDRILPLLPFARQWTSALESVGKISPTEGRNVNVRVYRDFSALRDYQVLGIRILKRQLLEPEEPQVDVKGE